MQRDDLERYLSPVQAAAWVIKRDVEFVRLCAKPDVYHGYIIWQDEANEGGPNEQDLTRALTEGLVSALGREKGKTEFEAVPAVKWRTMRVATQYPDRHHHPYAEIWVDRDQLLKQFPPEPRGKKSGRPITTDYGLIAELAKNYVDRQFGEMVSNVRADYENSNGPISESSIKRRLWKLGYGGSK